MQRFQQYGRADRFVPQRLHLSDLLPTGVVRLISMGLGAQGITISST